MKRKQKKKKVWDLVDVNLIQFSPDKQEAEQKDFDRKIGRELVDAAMVEQERKYKS